MALPELFHHQHRFIGVLSLRRQRQVSAGSRIGLWTLDANDVREQAAVADQVLYSVGPDDMLVLLMQAIASPVLNRCPALQDDGLCQIHFDRKPKTCSVVPLDPLLPDRLQHAVLAARSPGGTEYLGADCIVPGAQSGFELQTRAQAIVAPAAIQALAARRHDLAQDKHWWGQAVFAELQHEIFSQPGGLARIPTQGVLHLPLAPVLLRLATFSAACRQRCQRYAEAQSALIASEIGAALARKNPNERAWTAQLRQMASTLKQLESTLLHTAPGQRPDAAAIEHWLGITPKPPF